MDSSSDQTAPQLNLASVDLQSGVVAPLWIQTKPYVNLTCAGAMAVNDGVVTSVLLGPGPAQLPWWSVQQTGPRTTSLAPLANKMYTTVYGLAYLFLTY